MRVLVFCTALLALGGCKSSAELASAKAAEDDGYCASIGAPPGSAAYTQCRLQLRGEQERRDAHFRANPPFRTDSRIVPPGPTATCTTRSVPGALQTTCN